MRVPRVGNAGRIVVLAVLLASVAPGFSATTGGCCVCSDGRCIEGVEEMRACQERCSNNDTDGVVYRATGTCWRGICNTVRMRMKAEKESGGRGEK
jgi:hypothetical protein